jgi:hypothetical protein
MRRALSKGFSTKSATPLRIRATASGTVDQAVMTTMGSAGAAARTRSTSSRPSWPEVVSRA